MKKILFLSLILFSGCVIAPTIQSIKRAGVMEGDRQELLAKEIKIFHNSLSRGRSDDMVAFIVPEKQATIGAQLHKIVKTDKIVDSTVDNVLFTNDSFDADVTVIIKYFRVPVYMVDERTEKQHWTFSLTDGWKLSDREVVNSKS